ncbi:MAG: hypothetical protein BWY63_03927 [Chloroflexi bacterium ADurb.Bin360]|nr:MAG: hypothetical protein BWY63_03927 [Chloroflexi bacterium ADurb.Bin360]
MAAVDLAVQLRREDGDEVSCFAVKTRDLPVKPFGAKFTFEHDPDGELRTARFFGTGAPSGTLPAIEEAQLCIKLELHGSVNQSRIVEMVKDAAGIGRNTTLKAIRAMVEAGELIESESANQKFYALAEDGSGDG